MFKTETHLHVSEVSSCARLTAAEMVALYHQKGYQTLFITDHLSRRSIEYCQAPDLVTQVKNYQFRGYEAAKKAGEALGMHILCGTEISLLCTKNHYLLYGFEPSFLARPDLLELTPEALCRYAKEHGVFVVQAHPYRDEKCHPTFDCVDAVEGYNPNPRHENFTARTLALAKEYRLPITSGSDAHRPEDVAGGGILTATPITSPEDYISALKNGTFEPIR